MDKYIFIFLNFIDLILPLEKVLSNRVNPTKGAVFYFFLRFFENLVSYSVIYAIAKFVQFILSIILTISLEEIQLFYFAFPILLLSEMGLTGLYVGKLINFAIFLWRALIKFGILYGIDRLIMYYFL